ncbi:hypothetical protein BKE38_26255 [Pseudoroseomonas deserti]|uniref:Transcription-repair-coupling factor n=1 Tax=Teichococcus deserti TaxID=1817963 RepID=A0A1V2GUT4_9PROT|nr:hypothetical protein BKE38_26255 [Pseudoroseomonas deserti]
MSEPDSLLAARLAVLAAEAGRAGLVHLARSEGRAERVHRALRSLAPGLEVALLPAWDCLPYDRVSPSRAVMGRRMAALAQLARPAEGPRLLVASIAAATQRLPPPEAGACLRLEVGGAFDAERIEARLARLGYGLEEVVDDPGEAVLHGAVLDIFPPDGDSLPVRVDYAEGRVTALRHYDPQTQRGAGEVAALSICPASELVLPEDAALAHAPGLEHALPDFYAALSAPLDMLPGATLVLDPEVEALRPALEAEREEAYRARLVLAAGQEDVHRPPEPQRLFIAGEDWTRQLQGRRVIRLAEPGPEAEDRGVRRHLGEGARPVDGFLGFLQARLAAGGRVALAGQGDPRGRRLAALAAERLGLAPLTLDSWAALQAAPGGSFGLLTGPVETGFIDGGDALVAPDDILPAAADGEAGDRAAALPAAEAALRPGDAVIHLDHGLGILRGVETVEAGAARLDCLRLDYAGGTSQLVPLGELDRLWRYGAEARGLALDRLTGEAWPKRRAAVEAQIAETAAELARLAAERAARRAPRLRPPPAAFARFEAGFRYTPTPDQAAAAGAALADLASGRPMDRLVCGDVGYGKTEVALRAAAAAALAGRQVAVLAPTTVLVRQHLETFRRRFAGFGLRIEQLSRLSTPAEAKRIRAEIADGAIRIVIGTQALAAKAVRFKELGLVVIDEEQRFGARQKAALRGMAEGVHVMALTATPIPRSLQGALVGLQDLSVIATPPARRQPIRTAQMPFDEAVLRQALLREQRRGGQSFVVCPRIEDLPAMRGLLERLVPELSLIEAHGGMPAAETDAALVGFADGKADILLSTNIVEAGLDVPRANTMVVWRADRFGLAQLHQLRGRVGRGRRRGAILLLTDPAEPPAAATLKRLRTLEELDRVGAGFAISARDMDLRGAGDLLGDSQSGHLKLIGLGLYQHLLDRALRAGRGETMPEEWSPQVVAEIAAFIPEDYIDEEALRVALHTRLGAVLREPDPHRAEEAMQALAAEIADRFGPLPEPVGHLFALARLRLRCRSLGIAELKLGPGGAAASFRGDPPDVAAPVEAKDGRVLLRRDSQDAAAMLATAEALLLTLVPQRRRCGREAAAAA